MITQKYLKECLEYSQETGGFTWLQRPQSHFKNKSSMTRFNSVYAGKKAGSIDTPKNRHTSYLRISIDNKSYRAHRLAFLYVDGKLPEQVDHLDRNGLNNKWSNLSKSSASNNARNRRLRTDNTSGENCISFRKEFNRWVFQMHIVNEKPICKYFIKKEDAIAFRDKTYKEMGFNTNHGKQP